MIAILLLYIYIHIYIFHDYSLIFYMCTIYQINKYLYLCVMHSFDDCTMHTAH